MTPKIKVTFPSPQHGYWDGGAKSSGDFTPKHYGEDGEHPGSGTIIRWGSWVFNFWFTAGSGKSWKDAARIARNYLVRKCKVPGTTIEIC